MAQPPPLFTFKTDYLNPFPLPRLDLSQAADKSRQDRLTQLAEQMLALHKRQSTAKTPQEKTALERQIAATDTQLDTLIYALYGLTDGELKIVEASTG